MATNSGGLDSLVVLGFFCEQKQFGDKQFQASSGGFPTARKMRCIKIYIYIYTCVYSSCFCFLVFFSFGPLRLAKYQNSSKSMEQELMSFE